MNFDEAVQNNDYKKIMFSVCNRYRKILNEDDADSLRLQTLWECCQKYDPEHPKKAKFTSYLYDRLNCRIKNFLKKKNREKTGYLPEKSYSTDTLEFEILHSLTEEEKMILTQSYLENMTIEEIGKANGYSRETARRRLCKIRKKCRELLND